MENLGIFYDHLVYFTAIGNILGPFGIFSHVLVFWTEKNPATLGRTGLALLCFSLAEYRTRHTQKV
jgi:hypothetical protein